MVKYWSLFKITFQQEFVYKLNFVMWRIRNIIQVFVVFFLWDTVFSDSGKIIFGYDRSKILTYVFGLIIIRAVVLSTRSIDVAGEIARGELSTYLLKPISYFKYYFTKDMASKALNILFAAVESVILFIILRPPFFVQTNALQIGGFITSTLLAMAIFFVLVFLVSLVPFWMPQASWGAHFLFTVVVVEFLSGALFPLDVLPEMFQRVLNLTPFPYLIFYPVQIYLGQVQGLDMFRGLFISAVWIVVLWFILNNFWRKGLRLYEEHGI